MTTQSEQALENNLIDQLIGMGEEDYRQLHITNAFKKSLLQRMFV